MQVLVNRVLTDVNETVWRAEGTDLDTGERVRFAGDWRPMMELHIALGGGEMPVADVPDWAVIG